MAFSTGTATGPAAVLNTNSWNNTAAGTGNLTVPNTWQTQSSITWDHWKKDLSVLLYHMVPTLPVNEVV